MKRANTTFSTQTSRDAWRNERLNLGDHRLALKRNGDLSSQRAVRFQVIVAIST
jgi:hypothetical protein